MLQSARTPEYLRHVNSVPFEANLKVIVLFRSCVLQVSRHEVPPRASSQTVRRGRVLLGVPEREIKNIKHIRYDNKQLKGQCKCAK